MVVADSEDEDEEVTEETVVEEPKKMEGAMDPRAGSVHVTLPQIKLPFKLIVRLLKKNSNHANGILKGKKLLLSLAKQ